MPRKKSWPADNVERRALDSLVPYAKNARLHSKEQVAQLARSIEQWGWTIPVLIDPKGEIIAGHGRVMAAQSLGLKEVPVMVAKNWSKAQKKAYVIADNKLTENGGWDDQILAEEFTELEGLDFDLSALGFNDAEIGNILAGDEEGTDPVKEWEGMPEFNQGDQRSFRALVMHFPNKEAVEKFSELLGQEIKDTTKYLWYPEQVIDHVADQSYQESEAAE